MVLKDRLLVLLQILQDHTDDETWLTTAEIHALMEADGQDGCIRTLRKNVAVLKSCGY